MSYTCTISPEEEVAYKLADLAIRLHKSGLIGPYHNVLKARDSLLAILDEKSERHARRCAAKERIRRIKKRKATALLEAPKE